MKFIRPPVFLVGKMTRPVLTRTTLGIVIATATAACTGTERPDHASAVPPTYSQTTYHRPAGVQNTPYDTGNPPADLDPHTVHWGDVRPNY